MKPYLTNKEILQALEALNGKLCAAGTKAEIGLYGGTSMVLAFNARLSTRDVDAVFIPKGIVRKLAEELSQELGMHKNWLNDGVKGFLSDRGSMTNKGLPQFSHLQITRPTASYLLAMKCMAARAAGYDTQGDKEDIIFLMRRLNLSTANDVLDIVEQYYPKDRIAPKTQFIVLECVAELKNESADPA